MSANTRIELTDADWAATPRPVWLAMMDVRRERDNEAAARARLQQDYDAVRIALQQTHAQGAIAPTNNTADDNGRVAPDEVVALEQKLLQVRQEKEDLVQLSKANLKDALREQQERMRVDAENREREMATRLEQAEASAREATEKLANATRVAEESRQRLEGERNTVRTERDAAVARALAKEEELTVLRAELVAARELASAHAAVSVPAPAPVNDIAAQKLIQPPEPEPASVQLLDEDMDPNWLTPVPETPAATPKPDTAGDQTEIIDLSMDSDDETVALISPTRTKEIVVKSEPKASPAPLVSRNASPGPGPSTSRNRAKHAKRPVEDIEDAEPSKSAKRAKKLSNIPFPPSTLARRRSS
ncbi:hypothetical protein PENSPDRAFT_215799 [Peniophora sp. CONT]|nr:hypothetical protein PENSPDRAFT_215799 [Peniophora sp. CONT]